MAADLRFLGAAMPLQSATPAPSVLDEFLAHANIVRENRPVVLVFLRSDCPWCVSEVPRLSDVFVRVSKLHFAVLGIACGHDTVETANRFQSEKQLSFPVIPDDSNALRDAFVIGRVPTVVIINSRGLVERSFEGVTEQLAGIVEQTLGAVADDAPPPFYEMVGNGCAP
ncbi:hypothetical protein IAD21_04179 [Abditibacteriota bacterium]|nr:hypothetical protein IAD21_04179 [Abditibacteriota bacterium]